MKSIVSTLAWVGLGLVAAAVVVRFTMPDRLEVSQYLAMGGIATIVVSLLAQWRDIAAAFSQRNTQMGTLSMTSVLVFLGILVGVNYVAARQNKRWDLTANKQFSLSDQSRKVLGELKAPLALKVFDRAEGLQRFRDRLGEYSYLSSQVKVDYLDIDKENILAQQLEVQQLGTVVLQYEGRTERVTTDTEQEITNGIIKVVQGAQKKVYFVQGHGEKDPTSSDPRTGYSSAADALKRDNFSVEKLVLAQQTAIPADASVVVVAGPQADYFAPEVDAIKAYLNKGGKLMLELDPPTGADARDTPNLVALAKDWGTDVGTNVVLDISGMGQLLGTGPSVPVAATYPPHAITDRFTLVTAYPLARSVSPLTGGDTTRAAQTIVETGARSWGETDFSSLGGGKEVAFDEGKDKQGPVSVATAMSVAAPEQAPAPEAGATPPAEPPAKKETRVSVFGDSDFASNGAVGIQGNRDLFVNVVNWLAQQENLISIRAKDPEDRRVNMTADQQFRTAILTVLLIPAIVFVAGIAKWWQRRG
ncbi:MAG: Gldg family protein [Vicinamibacterales bacterium]